MKVTVLFFATLLSFQAFAAPGEGDARLIRQADSVFRLKQYTQSFELYDSLFHQKRYSSAMLLKMAYIQEGLGHTGLSMYYLNLYYIASSDPHALTQLNKQATRYHLEGYDDSALRIAQAFVSHYRNGILAGLSALCFVFFALAIFFKFRLKQRPLLPVAFVLFFALATYGFLLTGNGTAHGIVAAPNTYLMKGPSAGAGVAAIVDEGHRLEITGKKDVWLRVQWREEEVYVKEREILKVGF